MKPIQFFSYQQTVWYNVLDYIAFLVDTKTIWLERPAELGKRKRQPRSPEQVVFAKLNRLNQSYQIRLDQEIYADWVIFEHLYRLLKPYLIRPTDWTNPDGLFWQTQQFIDRSKRLTPYLETKSVVSYFKEIYPEQFD